MSLPITQSSIVDSLSISGPTKLQFNGSRKTNIVLLCETIFVTTIAILAIKIIETTFISKTAWFAVPAVLVAAALAPAAIRKQKLTLISFDKKQISNSVKIVLITCLVLFPATLLMLWLLGQWGLQLYLWPTAPSKHQWIAWLVYQFMYVAIAEELFFRGYIQRNILNLIRTVVPERNNLHQWTTICISAAVFAIAHIIVQGSTLSVLTFLPGLVLGWLLIRTRSLLAPILFHGLANTFYIAIAVVLT
jgi:membrane protease YdiL (CAAX protease family)